MRKSSLEKCFEEDELELYQGILAKSAKPARVFLRAEDTQEVKKLLGEALGWVIGKCVVCQGSPNQVRRVVENDDFPSSTLSVVIYNNYHSTFFSCSSESSAFQVRIRKAMGATSSAVGECSSQKGSVPRAWT